MVVINSNSSSLEFQSLSESWHSVDLTLQGKILSVTYSNSFDSYHGSFSTAEFKDLKDLDTFIKRFRPTSLQLRDNECHKVSKGMTVCASHDFSIQDVRFHDAVVLELNRKDHKPEEGTMCTCTFTIYWLCGPNMAKTTVAVVSQIRLIQSQPPDMDQTLSSFVEMCREKLNVTSQCQEVKMSYKDIKASVVKKEVEETSGSYFVVIENLEKDLGSSAIVDFVKKHLAMNSEAQVYPSLSKEQYSRGIIIVNSLQELHKLSDFLHSPAHMILSPKGRPWVIAEEKSCHGSVRAKMGNLASLLENPSRSATSEEIRLVSKGTEEYERGKQLKDLFLEFADHQQGLQEKFAMVVSKIT